MAYSKTTYKIIHDYAVGHFLPSPGLNAPAGFVTRIPDLWALDEFELVVHCYEYYSATAPVYSDFGNVATAKLYIKRRDSDETATELSTGVVSVTGTTYNVLTFAVAKDKVPASLANLDCILYYVVSNSTTEKRTGAQFLAVVDESGDQSANLDLSQMEITATTISAATAFTEVNAWQFIILDGTAAPATLTLPTTPAKAWVLWVVASDVTSACKVVAPGGFYGTGGETDLVFQSINDSHLIICDGTRIYKLNNGGNL
jgi:hypothetical protein